MAEGWVSIYRSLSESEMWLKEPFTKGQAWVDLIMLANHKDGYYLYRGIKMDVNRGDVGWSVEALAKRWKWSRNKINGFYAVLKHLDMICPKTDIKTDIKLPTIITIINYDKYQIKDIKTDIKRTSKGHQKDINNNDNKKNKEIYKEKEVTTTPTTEVTSEAKKYLEFFNLIRGTKFQTTRTFEKNLTIWLKEYTLDDIKHALENIPFHSYWKDKMDNPDILLRTKDTKGNECDRIGDLLNVKKPKEIIL